MLMFPRHWIAVFGQVFKRSIKTTVEDLRKHFSGSGGGTVTAMNEIHTDQIELHVHVLRNKQWRDKSLYLCLDILQICHIFLTPLGHERIVRGACMYYFIFQHANILSHPAQPVKIYCNTNQ